MELLQAATKDGAEVLKKRSSKKLVTLLFSKQLMGILNKAKGDVEEVMRLPQTSNTGTQISTSEKMKRKIENVKFGLGHKIENIKHDMATEVAALIRSQMTRPPSHGASVALSEAFV
jgi:hypothetical protein